MKTLFIILMSAMVHCSEEAMVDSQPAVLLPATRIKEVALGNGSASFTISCVAPNPCYGFDRLEKAVKGTEMTIKIYGKRTTNDPCIQVVSNIDVTADLKMPKPGRYRVKFFGKNGATVDTTVVMKW